MNAFFHFVMAFWTVWILCLILEQLEDINEAGAKKSITEMATPLTKEEWLERGVP